MIVLKDSKGQMTCPWLIMLLNLKNFITELDFIKYPQAVDKSEIDRINICCYE